MSLSSEIPENGLPEVFILRKLEYHLPRGSHYGILNIGIQNAYRPHLLNQRGNCRLESPIPLDYHPDAPVGIQGRQR